MPPRNPRGKLLNEGYYVENGDVDADAGFTVDGGQNQAADFHEKRVKTDRQG